LDTAVILENQLSVPGLSLINSTNFSVKNGQIIGFTGEVDLEYLLENDTLYLEGTIFEEPDGMVDKTKADAFTKIE